MVKGEHLLKTEDGLPQTASTSGTEDRLLLYV